MIYPIAAGALFCKAGTRVILFAFVIVFAHVCVLYSGPLGQGIIDNVSVTVGGREYKCLLFPSQEDEALWYCVLKTPFLAERIIDGIVEPELRIFRFQRPDPRNPNKLIEAGTIQCAFAVAPSDEILERLKSLVPSSGGRPVHIQPLPLSGTKLSIFSLQGNKISAVASPTRAIGSSETLRTAAFNITLPTFDSGFMEVLVNELAGVKFELQYNTSVLDLSPAAVRGTIDAERGQRSPDSTTSMSPGSAIIPRSNPNAKTVAPSSQPKSGVSTLLPESGGVSAGSLRDLTRSGGRTPSASGDERDKRAAQDWQSFQKNNAARRGWTFAANGFLGLGRYPKEVRERNAISENEQDGWRFAYLLLPVIPDSPGLPLEAIGLEVTLKRKGQEYGKWSFFWTHDLGWRDGEKKPARVAKIPIHNLLAGEGDPLGEATFVVKKRVECEKNDILTGEEVVPVRRGDYPLSSPADLVELVKLDFGLIDWMKPDSDPTGLKRIEVRLREGDRNVVKFVQPLRLGGFKYPPAPVQWLVAGGSTSRLGTVQATITFETADGKRIPWSLNGKPIDQDFSSGIMFFSDEDWKR